MREAKFSCLEYLVFAREEGHIEGVRVEAEN